MNKVTTNPPTIIQIEEQEQRIKEEVFFICMGKEGGVLNFGDWNY